MILNRKQSIALYALAMELGIEVEFELLTHYVISGNVLIQANKVGVNADKIVQYTLFSKGGSQPETTRREPPVDQDSRAARGSSKAQTNAEANIA